LSTKELAVASQQCTVSHFFFHQRIFDEKQHDYRPPTHFTFSVSPNEGKTERPTSRMHLKIAEVLETMHTR
jgi:hypothetical protein